MDYFFEFSQRSSEISQDFFPPISLNPERNYVLGLYSLTTYNSISNIKQGVNDIIAFEPFLLTAEQNTKQALPKQSSSPQTVIIQVPAGSYEIAQLGEYLSQEVNKNGIKFSLTLNPSTMKVEMKSSATVIFPKNSIREILGFRNLIYPVGVNVSEMIPQISSINIINVECNIISGSFRNGKLSHSLYSFAPSVPTGYKMIERPTNILFLPVHDREITNITLRLTDQDGQIVHFNDEQVTINLVLREL